MNSNNHPYYNELIIHSDGRIFDIDQDKFINIHTNHGGSQRGPIALWNRKDGVKITLSVLRVMYETFIYEDILPEHWIVIPKDESGPISIDNLKRTKRYKREAPPEEKRNQDFEDWFGTGAGLYM